MRSEIIRQIHDSDLKLSLAVTGGGSRLISELVSRAGASRTVVDARVPYSKEALIRMVRQTPKSFCSAKTARQMAVSSYFENVQRTVENLPAASPDFFSLACTAALSTDQNRDGEDRFFLCLQNSELTRCSEVRLTSGQWSRHEQEELIVDFALSEIARLMGLDYARVRLKPGDSVRAAESQTPTPYRDIFLGNVSAFLANTKSDSPGHDPRSSNREIGCSNVRDPRLTGGQICRFGDDFRTLSADHRSIAQSASRYGECETEYVMDICNESVFPLDYLTIEQRLAPLENETVWLSRAKDFQSKAKIFPDSVFLISLDTLRRLADSPDFQHPDSPAVLAMQKHRCRFLVYGVKAAIGDIPSLDGLNSPPALLQLCEALPDEFTDQPG